MEHLSNDHEGCPSQDKNSHMPCDEAGPPILSVTKSQWQLKQPHDQNFKMEEESLQNKS